MSADPRHLAALAHFEIQASQETPRHGVREIFAVEELFFRTLRPVSRRIERPSRRLSGRKAA